MRAPCRRRCAVVILASLGSLLQGASASAQGDPCLEDLTDEANRMGTEGNDQIWGTSGDDVILGLGGHDVIKGFAGDDIICGGRGEDGINAGDGADRVGGGLSADLIVGHDGDDAIYGGMGEDGMFGGFGADVIAGNDDSDSDYLVGGPGTDELTAGDGDEAHPDAGADDACPPLFAAWIGAYGTDKRLRLADDSQPCMTLTGKIHHLRNARDGDRKFKLRGLIIEFMPRDKGHFPRLEEDKKITLRGLHVFDGHGNEEIHPVYRVAFDGTDFSGPQFAGSPHRLRPVTDCDSAPDSCIGVNRAHRYCWDELGRPCQPWARKGKPFH